MDVFRSLVRYLRDFVRSFQRSQQRPVGSTPEKLARFLTARKQFDRARNALTPLAFLLRGDQSGVSVFEIADLNEAAIRDLSGHISVNKIFGYGSITSEHVRSVGLRFERDDTPIRHGNLIDWPVAKEEQMSIAQQLAAVAVPTFY